MSGFNKIWYFPGVKAGAAKLKLWVEFIGFNQYISILNA